MTSDSYENPFIRDMLKKHYGTTATDMGIAVTLGNFIDSCPPRDGECTGYWSSIMKAAVKSGAIENPYAIEFLLSKIRQYSA
jgi:hypothetical protein